VNIADLVTRSGKRIWIVVFTVALAAGAAFYFSSNQPQQYSAVASVTVVQPAGTPPTGQIVNQSVENLRSTVDSRGLAQIVSEATGASIGEVRGSLSTQRLRTGNVVEIVSASDEPAEAVAIAQSAALEAVRQQVESELAVAEQGVALARTRYEDADSDLTAFVVELGTVDPEAVLAARTAALLEAQVALAAVEPDDEAALILRTKDVENAEEALEGLPPLILSYRTLVSERDAAFEALNASTSRQLEAQATANVASKVLVVTPQKATAVSRRQDIGQSVIAAGVVGLILGLGILAVIEVFPSRARARRARRQAEPDSPEPPDES
jgi:hypothetical protein